MRRVIRAGLAGAVLSGIPSTVHALVTGRDLLAAARAAGSLAVGDGRSAATELAAGVAVHGALSLAWAAVLVGVLPGRRPLGEGAAAGLAIAALDLGVIGRRIDAIRRLPPGPQVADHVVYGIVVSLIAFGRCSGSPATPISR